MAAYGAHLTGTQVEEENKPSIFEILAQENLMSALGPGLKYALKVLAEKNPERYGWLYGLGNEMNVLLGLILEHYYLKHYNSSFSENFYGMKRVQLPHGEQKQTTSSRLPRSTRLKSLILIVMLPYLKQKCDQLYESSQGQDQVQPQTATRSHIAKLSQAFLAMYPYLHFVWESLIFIFHLRYVFGNSRVHSPLLRLAGVCLENLTQDDISNQAASTGKLNFAGRSLVGNITLVLNRALGVLAVSLSSGLSVGIFFLQFLEWWYASEHSAKTLTALPKPPAPKKLQFDSLPKLPTICPLCNKIRVNDTALAVSGFVFCYPCIYTYVRDHHQCPVTGYPALTDHLVRLYLSDT